MHTKTDAQPVGMFLENDQRPEFLLIWGPKWPKNWSSEAHILHISKSTWNEHVKQYCCETSENFWEITKHQNLFLLWGPKWPRNWAFEAHILLISESSSNAHINKTDVNPDQTFQQNIRKPEFWFIWRPKMVQNLGLWCLSFTHLQK